MPICMIVWPHPNKPLPQLKVNVVACAQCALSDTDFIPSHSLLNACNHKHNCICDYPSHLLRSGLRQAIYCKSMATENSL